MLQVMDFLPLYPAFLWKDPSAPLHFIYTFNRFIVELSGDPFARSPSSYPWFEAMTLIELVSQFPLAVYLIYKMLQKRPIDAPAEVAGLAFGCLNFMGSTITTFELWHMLPATFAPGQQNKLIYTEFGPYAVICELNHSLTRTLIS
jgi:hypothetical protein